MKNKILILIETQSCAIAPVSAQIAGYCAENFDDCETNGLLLIDNSQKNCIIEKLKGPGFDNVFVCVDERFGEFSGNAFTKTVSDFLKQNPHDIFLIGATSFGREIAPRIAARNDLGLTADCTSINIDENGVLLATRPTYGGQLMAEIVSKTKPYFATIRPGALKHQKSFEEKPLNIKDYYADLENVIEAVKLISSSEKPLSQELENAEIIIAGGLGMKTKENFEQIYTLCELLNAKPASSRAAVELGWAPAEIQVGQTGHSVSPKLYIALGISGAMQHLVGISSADKIIAVNTDKNAPIFESCDIGVAADAPSFVKSLIERLRA